MFQARIYVKAYPANEPKKPFSSFLPSFTFIEDLETVFIFFFKGSLSTF